MRKAISTQDLVVLYTEKHLTLREIAVIVGITHAGVWKRLRAAGIHVKQGEWVSVQCSYCGVPFSCRRGRWKKQKDFYCQDEHYWASRQNENFVEWRQGGRLARAIVAQHFKLERDHIVHHKDADQRNNDRANLMVFMNQSDHLKHHRGQVIHALWDGAID